MIKLDLLRSFVVVARHGGLKGAAEELGRTQSALSMSLAQIEAQLGGSLFETDRKKELTHLGRYVHDRADELLRENDRMQELIVDYARGQSGRLRIASVPSVAALILPTLLSDFLARHRSAEIELMDSDSTNVRSMVELGHADLGIAGPAPSGQSLQKTVLFEDRLHVVCHAGSELSHRRGSLRWRDLDGTRLVANGTLTDIEAPEARKLIAQSKLSARNVSSLVAMVQSGLGFTILPGLATRQLAQKLVALPINDKNCNREISLFARTGRTLSPLARSFQSFLVECLPGIVSEVQASPAHSSTRSHP